RRPDRYRQAADSRSGRAPSGPRRVRHQRPLARAVAMLGPKSSRLSRTLRASPLLSLRQSATRGSRLRVIRLLPAAVTLVIGAHDSADQRVAHDVGVREPDEIYSLDASQHVDGIAQSGAHAAGQID